MISAATRSPPSRPYAGYTARTTNAVSRHLVGELVDEAGGADPGLAAQQHDRRPPVADRVAPLGAQERELVVAADQRRTIGTAPRSRPTRVSTSPRSTSTGSRLPFSTTGRRSR